MLISRKEFLIGLGASALSTPLVRAEGAKPLLKFGVMTDTHFGRPDVEGVGRVEKAWKLFRAKGCGLVVNCGDIADRFYPNWYAEACKLRERTFDDPQTAPREVWVYAGHDRIDMPDDKDKGGVGNYALLKEKLKIPHEAYHSFELAGFQFVVVPQTVDMKRYERMVAEAAKKCPGKPVFVFDHVPAQNTTENSAQWGDARRLKMLSNYPQVVHITGHAHGSLCNEQNIHQGAFTSVSAGCLTYFNEPYVGASHAEGGQNRSVLLFEVFADFAVIRRYRIDTGDEIGADEPWTIRWPYDPKDPFYSRENMRARHLPPAFAAGAALAVRAETRGSSGRKDRKLVVDIPETGSRFVRHYRVDVLRPDGAGNLRPFVRHDIRGQFWKEPKARRKCVTAVIDAGCFRAGETIDVRVTPCDFWGNEGAALVWRGPAPVDAGKELAVGPMSPDSHILPEIPPEAVGKSLKIVVDAEFDQPGPYPVNFGVKPCDFWWVGTVATPPGKSRLTYVFTIGKVQAGKRYEFAFRGGSPGWKVKYSNLRMLL